MPNKIWAFAKPYIKAVLPLGLRRRPRAMLAALNGVLPANIWSKWAMPRPFSEVELLSLARAVSASGPHRVWSTLAHEKVRKTAENIKMGFYGNMANNHYCAVKALRKMGCDAELVLEDAILDTYLMNRPFWQDLDVEAPAVEDAYAFEKDWPQPACVRRTQYDYELAERFEAPAAHIRVRNIYKEHFGQDIAPDSAVLLARHMGYWPYIKTFRRYDICFFSSAAIPLAVFCPIPFIIIPTGGDINLMPFWENLQGFLTKAAYIRADGIFSHDCYADALRRMALTHKTTAIPIINAYSPPLENGERIREIRSSWAADRDTLCILGVSRQNWEWKGNDVLLRAFAKFGYPKAKLILMHWGQDLEKTKETIAKLGLTAKIIWEPVSSRPRLFQKMIAADVVCDQFVMGGFGTSIVESLLAGTPVISRDPSNGHPPGQSPPPILPADDEEAILQHLRALTDFSVREELGRRCREWALRERYSDELVRDFVQHTVTIAGRHI